MSERQKFTIQDLTPFQRMFIIMGQGDTIS